jgi:hypothetical protein
MDRNRTLVLGISDLERPSTDNVKCSELVYAHSSYTKGAMMNFKDIQQDLTELNAEGNRERGRNGEDITLHIETEEPILRVIPAEELQRYVTINVEGNEETGFIQPVGGLMMKVNEGSE